LIVIYEFPFPSEALHPRRIVTIMKSITARGIFKKHPEVKKELWGGEFWSDGYFVNTVSKFGDEETIIKYVKEQGTEKEYKILYKTEQLELF
jgi:REP element-mobilizing transposase RayT